jgi:AcrR family transcriptional regulator
MLPDMRADARRNRAELLSSAAELFAAEGPDVPLATIAERASVGVGTLYRHFPTREALIAATYANEITQLGQVDAVLEHQTGADALVAWMGRFIGFARTKRALSEILHAPSSAPVPTARATIVEALSKILTAGAEDQSLRDDVDAEDVLRATAGLWTGSDQPDWDTRADRLSRLIIDGLRTDSRAARDLNDCSRPDGATFRTDTRTNRSRAGG